MKAVILAGGKGTRLGTITQDIPKPMVELAGKPILQYQVELCARYKIEEIIIIVNHLGNVIEDYFGDGKEFDIPIRYFYEEQPLGTVGGIKEMESELSEDFLVLYGDVMMEMDLTRLINFHERNDSEVTLVVHPNDHPYDSDLVELDDDDRIIRVIPKPHPEGMYYHNMVNAAVYLFSPAIFEHLEKGVKADFGKDIFPAIYDKVRMFGYNTPEYLKDMGTPERMGQVEKDIASGKVARRSLSHKQMAIFLDRDGVLNEDIDLIHKPEDLHLFPNTPAAVKTINRSEYLAIVATNQSVVARNLTTIEGLNEIHKKMETELGQEGAKLDLIKYCPHHPDKGYPEENRAYKIDCHCRKPKPGMLTDAAGKFNIDLGKSWMIGDSERDTGAGRAAGCQTVGVMTGQGHRKARELPDYFFANLNEAVNFIVNDPYRSYADTILKTIRQQRGFPYVINIGGNSRSGKSILHAYLKHFLEQNDLEVLSISLDDWILPKEERSETDEVFHNFQMPKLEKQVKKILTGEKVELNAYAHHPERETQNKVYQRKDEQVIIVEGVVAVSSEVLRDLADLTIFMQIDEAKLKERFSEFYLWKGYKEEDIQKLWDIRLNNEYRVISKDSTRADIVI